MNKKEYVILENQFKKDKLPFQVLFFFCKPLTNQHAFAISTGDSKIGVGLPNPREMIPVDKFTNEHESRTPDWEKSIIDQRLYWAPAPDDQKKSGGKFYVLKMNESANKPESYQEECDDGGSMILEKKPPTAKQRKLTEDYDRTY